MINSGRSNHIKSYSPSKWPVSKAFNIWLCSSSIKHAASFCGRVLAGGGRQWGHHLAIHTHQDSYYQDFLLLSVVRLTTTKTHHAFVDHRPIGRVAFIDLSDNSSTRRPIRHRSSRVQRRPPRWRHSLRHRMAIPRPKKTSSETSILFEFHLKIAVTMGCNKFHSHKDMNRTFRRVCRTITQKRRTISASIPLSMTVHRRKHSPKRTESHPVLAKNVVFDLVPLSRTIPSTWSST